jgi:hypothetical protein
MIVAVHHADGRKTVAVCDESLLGKKFEETDVQLDLSSEYFKGSLMNAEQLSRVLVDAASAYFVGEQSTSYAVEKGLAAKTDIQMIAKIPHVQVIF